MEAPFWEKRAKDKGPTCFVLDLLCLVAYTVGFDGIYIGSFLRDSLARSLFGAT